MACEFCSGVERRLREFENDIIVLTFQLTRLDNSLSAEAVAWRRQMESIIGQHSEACALIKRHSSLHVEETQDLLALATACGSAVGVAESGLTRA
jgi:hypothetical protein